MTLIGKWVRKKILITVKAYPQPSQKYIESVCTAGITEEGNWIRLYPVQYRDLPPDFRFKKYQWIEVDICKSSDPRPESYRINHDTLVPLNTIGTKDGWAERKKLVLPLKVQSLERLQEMRTANNTSLGIIKPKRIVDFVIENSNLDWSEKQKKVLQSNQLSMFGIGGNRPLRDPNRETCRKLGLEKIPFKFSYYFFCDDDHCTGHKLQILDWEIGQAYRNWRKNYSQDVLLKKIRERFFDSFTTQKDLHLYLGTLKDLHKYGTFSIIGLFYPPL